MRLGSNILRNLAYRSLNLSSSTAQKMSRRVLLAFDFDHTIVDDNTDIVARNLVREIPQSTKDLYRKDGWIDYMEKIFEHLYQDGVTSNRITGAIRNIPEVPGMLSLLHYLRRPDCEVVIMSDSNSVFITTWLEKHHLLDLIRYVYTNPAYFDASGQLHVSKYHIQNWCALSSVNMCKGHVLESHLNSRKKEGVNFTEIVYIGDGHNDLCPSLYLSPSDYLFVRSGYSLEKVLKSESEQVKAKVHFWRIADDILDVIKNNIIKDENTVAC